MRTALVLLGAWLVAGCGAAATPAPVTPRTAASAPAPAPATAPTGTPAAAKAAGLPEAPAGVPPAPASCSTFSAHAVPACAADGDKALDALDAALGESDPATRDAKLAALEKCSAFPTGLMRALRADLAPAQCGDALVDPVLAARAQTLDASIHDALVGLGLGARLARLVHQPPRLQPPFDKQRFHEFFDSKLAPWIAGQARAIHDIAAGGAKLHGYGEGIVAVESGMADMRFVEVVRNVPLPDELAKDKELKDIYYSSLDEALEPRKNRGRDAALVGLEHFATEGALADPRVDEARAMLSRLYGGRRIDALDSLMLPALAPFQPQTRSERLASRLPTFYAGFVLSKEDPTDPALLRAFLERGIPPAAQKKLDAAKLASPVRELYARFLVRLGQTYWRSNDFSRAAAVSATSPTRSPGAPRLIAALAQALQGGPRDAAEMMLKGPFLPGGVGDVAALDRLAHSRSPIAGMAAFDAAYIRQLVAPAKAKASYWTDLAKRYRAAARQLKQAKLRSRALAHEKATKATAKAIRKKK